MVDKSQVSFFQENGYLSYGSVLQMSEVEELRRDLDKVIQIELDGGDDTEPEFRYGHRRNNEDEVGMDCFSCGIVVSRFRKREQDARGEQTGWRFS